MHHVVVWDPEGDYWEGAIVDSQKAVQLAGRGVASLPCVAEVFRFAGVSGFAKRAWGAGWPLDTVVPALVCPLSIYSPGQLPGLEWCARVVPTESGKANLAAGREVAQGVLRIAAGEHRGLQRAVVAEHPARPNAVEIAKLGAPDEDGGWTIYGHALLQTPGEGYYGLSLYGFAPGLRVVWVAATLTP